MPKPRSKAQKHHEEENQQKTKKSQINDDLYITHLIFLIFYHNNIEFKHNEDPLSATAKLIINIIYIRFMIKSNKNLCKIINIYILFHVFMIIIQGLQWQPIILFRICHVLSITSNIHQFPIQVPNYSLSTNNFHSEFHIQLTLMHDLAKWSTIQDQQFRFYNASCLQNQEELIKVLWYIELLQLLFNLLLCLSNLLSSLLILFNQIGKVLNSLLLRDNHDKIKYLHFQITNLSHYKANHHYNQNLIYRNQSIVAQKILQVPFFLRTIGLRYFQLCQKSSMIHKNPDPLLKQLLLVVTNSICLEYQSWVYNEDHWCSFQHI